MKALRTLGIAVFASLVLCSLASAQFQEGTWTKLTNAPSSAVAHALMLSDGSVLVNSMYFSNHSDPWYRLIPDKTGSYLNGTWVNAGTLPSGYNPLYFASQLLPNGDVVIAGGEYNNGSGVWTTKGALYNPLTNTWTSTTAPSGWTTIGDAESIMLPSGHMMLANCCTTAQALLTLTGTTTTWTITGTGKSDENDEEGWVLLPDGNVLTVDAYVNSYSKTGTNSEIYNYTTGTWSSAGSTIVQLWDSASSCGGEGGASYEEGPGALRPGGTVFWTGANACGAGNTANYDTTTGTWTAGPTFPSTYDIADGPGSELPDGNVLLDASKGIFETGSAFYEWDGSVLNPTTAPTNASIDSSYVGGFVLLPTGQVLFTDFSSTVEIYTPVGSPCTGCAPTVSHVAATLTAGSKNNKIAGTQFTGQSQGSTYGDDNQSDTNYPLVRIVDSAGDVVYCRTHNWTPGVQTGTKLVQAQFDIPAAIHSGAATLYVVASGIASSGTAVTIN